MEPRERRALRVLARTLAWVVAVPLGLVGAGAVVQQGQAYRQHRLEDDRAHALLVDWAQAVTSVAVAGRRFVPVGDLTAQVGDWEPEVGENDKLALLSGQVEASPTARFDSPPGQGVVRWADGVTASVPVLSPAEGVAQIRAAPPPAARRCDCRPLVVTGAVLGLAEVDTNAGRATVPVWQYTIEGTAVVVTRVAVRPDAAATLQAREDTRSRSLRGVLLPDGWSLRPDGRTLTILFSGADGPGSRPCGADYAARAVTSATGVVVVLRQTSPSYWRQVARVAALGDRYDACPAYAVFRTVDVRLDAPLGDRTVLDVVTGTPLPRFPSAA